MIHTSSTIFYNLKKKSIFFVKRICYINCLKYTKRLKIDHKKEKWVKYPLYEKLHSYCQMLY